MLDEVINIKVIVIFEKKSACPKHAHAHVHA